MAESKLIKSIVIDTFTAFQKDEILRKWQAGKANYDDWKDYGTDIVVFNNDLISLGFTLVGVLGYEGTGKSFGMKSLEADTNIWYNADRKNATWVGGKQQYGTINGPTRYMTLPTTYSQVISHIKDVKSKNLFVLNPVAFLLGHIEDYKSVGGEIRQRLKTFGKVANKMNIEDKLTMCYYTAIHMEGDKPKFCLKTQNSGMDTCRTNEGMHNDLLIPNNFQTIFEAIEKF